MLPSHLRALLLLTLLAVAPAPASADFTGIGSDETTRLVYARAGHARYANALAFGYAARLAPETVECPAVVFVEVGFEAHDDALPLEPDTGTLRLGMRVELVRAGRFALPAQGALSIGMNLEELTRVVFRTEAALMPGYYAARGLVAAELGLRSTWGEAVTEREDNATRGFHGDASQSLRAGLRVGVVIASRLELVTRGGFEDVEEGIQRAPTYVDVSAGLRF